MVRFFAALLFMAVAISTSEADDNHQEQNFDLCGHKVSAAECDVIATVTLVPIDDSTKPNGCIKEVTGYAYNSNANTNPCTNDVKCICDKLVGAFAASAIVCNSLGFDPTFTYSPGGQTQDVIIDITLGASSDANCISQKSSELATDTVTGRADFESGVGAQISYGTVAAPACDGALTHWTDGSVEKIKYLVDAVAIVTRNFRTKRVQRKRKFLFRLQCLMVRELTASSDQSFTVEAALIDANEVELASHDFTFAATLKFYDAGYLNAHMVTVRPNNNEKVYAKIEKGADQALFVYRVKRCFATINDIAFDAATADVFFDNQCPTDETMDFKVDGSGDFMFDIQAFSFMSNAAGAVYLHCDLRVCLADAGALAADCSQKAQSTCTNPIANNRRRRDVSYESLSNGGYREETISSSQPILLEGSQFHAPQCGDGFVYDRVAKECSRSNLIVVKGIRLASDVFKADFYNTSSKAFKDMAREKEYLLWVLIKATGQDKTIRGVQVIAAIPGSVILDVAVRYADTVTPEQAFTTFKQVLKAPASTTRVQNVLQITQEKTIEYIPVVRQGEKADTEKLILIVVVVVLFVVVFIAGVTLFKVRQVRQQTSNAQAAGFENKGVDA